MKYLTEFQQWWDVARHKDLIRLRGRMSSGESEAPHTVKIINSFSQRE